MKEYKINEIFYSLQGEGSYAGQPMVFVRFSGCNLRCDFCDTPHQTFKKLTALQILDNIRLAICSKLNTLIHMPSAHSIPVCLTGGEPTLQMDDYLLATLAVAGHPVHVETNGLIVPPGLNLIQHITISPKTRLLGIREEIEPMLIRAKQLCDLKVVWNEEEDEMLRLLLSDWGDLTWKTQYIQPVYKQTGLCDGERQYEPSNLKAVLSFIKENPQWRLSIQIQKHLNIP